MVPDPPRPHCSLCGSTDDLHVATVLMCGPVHPSRVLVYCPECRAELSHMLGSDVPLTDVDVELFVGLYLDGKTESDPETAAESVFGEPFPDYEQWQL